jgi:hypothetical protein
LKLHSMILSACCLFCYTLCAQAPPVMRAPKTLYECDVLPSRKVCAVWTWNGQAYDGTWPDSGAQGKMSVSRMDAGGVVIKRIDTAGATQGLTATYTGRWNGNAIVGGQVSWTWNGHTASNGWTGSIEAPAKDPDQVAAEKEAADKYIPVEVIYGHVNGNDDTYGVKNLSGTPLTAYEVITVGRSGVEWARMEDYRITQAGSLEGGQSRIERYIFSPGTRPSGLHVAAAVFADGTVKGEASRVDSLMARRREQLFTYRTMSQAICSMARQREDLNTILSTLAARKTEYVHAFPTMAGINRAVEDAYASVIRDLRDSSKEGVAAGEQKTLRDVMRLSEQLKLDPVRDAGGKLYLGDAPLPAVCRPN